MLFDSHYGKHTNIQVLGEFYKGAQVILSDSPFHYAQRLNYKEVADYLMSQCDKTSECTMRR